MKKSELINRFDGSEDEDATGYFVQFDGRKMSLEEYAKWKKDHYMVADVNKYIEAVKTEKKKELVKDRDDGLNSYTDTEIQKIVDKEIKNDHLFPEGLYDPKNRANHKPEYIFRNLFHTVSLSESFEKIRYKATETFLIIVFSDREIIGEIVKESKNENCIEGTETQAAMREVLIKYPNADSIIIAHNHPHHIVAEPSEEDKVRTLHTRIALKYFEIKLLDSFVVTDVDTFSILQKEMEEKNWKERFQKDVTINDRLLPLEELTNIYENYNKYLPLVLSIS